MWESYGFWMKLLIKFFWFNLLSYPQSTPFLAWLAFTVLSLFFPTPPSTSWFINSARKLTCSSSPSSFFFSCLYVGGYLCLHRHGACFSAQQAMQQKGLVAQTDFKILAGSVGGSCSTFELTSLL